MDLTFIDWIVDQAGLAAFASFALWINFHSHRDGLNRERENADIHRADKLRMSEALLSMAETNTELCQLIGEMRNDLKERR